MRGLGHRLQAEGHRQDRQAVLAGIDPAHAAAAERVVVGVEVLALVHDAAEDDHAARFEMLDRLDQREGLLDDWLIAPTARSGTANGLERKSIRRGEPARNASMTSRCTSRNCSIVAR